MTIGLLLQVGRSSLAGAWHRFDWQSTGGDWPSPTLVQTRNGPDNAQATKKPTGEVGLVVVFTGFLGGSAEIRTRDQRIKSPLLYRLSYRPTGRGKIITSFFNFDNF